MHLTADEVTVTLKEDDDPYGVGFRDKVADYCVVLTRFSDLEPDDGTIEVMVQDQVHAKTAGLRVDLSRAQCRIRLEPSTAKKLLGKRDYVIDFEIDNKSFDLVATVLRTIFQGLKGLTINTGERK